MEEIAVIQLDMMQTVALAIVMLYVGKFLRQHIKFFDKFCVPTPVIGGFLFAILHFILKASGICTFAMDTTLKNPFMMVFFTTIGLGANLATLKMGGKGFLIFTLLSSGLVLLQNVIGMGTAKLLGENAYLGLACGSITMIGGHGTAGAWGSTLEKMGLAGGTTVALAAATFGVIMGSLIGGPIGDLRVRKHGLTSARRSMSELGFEVRRVKEFPAERKQDPELRTADFLKVLCVVFISVSLGVVLKKILQNNVSIMGTPLNLPEYVTSMLFAALFVNTLGKHDIFKLDMRVNNICGEIGLNIFLVIALIGLDLMDLKNVAGPMLIILFVQTIVMALYAYYATFIVMGRDYDAAVLSGGMCGFGMGATYNALANMDSITEKYGPAQKAYFILPMVGAFAIDIINLIAITLFSFLRF